MAAQVFISYSAADGKVARTICSSLESRGLSCWIASRDVGPGENFMDSIVHAIQAAKVMVLVFSESANNSDAIKRELVLAGNANIIVIPVRVEDVAPRDSFAYQLATRQWIDLFEDWESQIDRLSGWIARSLESARPGVTAKPEGKTEAAPHAAAIDAGQIEAQSGQDATEKQSDHAAELHETVASAPPRLPEAPSIVGKEVKSSADQDKAGPRPSRRGVIVGASASAAVATIGGTAGYLAYLASRTPGLIRTFSTRDTVSSVTFLPDGRSAMAAGSELSLWDVATGSLIRKFAENGDYFTAAAVLPNGRAVFAADGLHHQLHLYELGTGAEFRTFAGHSDDINAVAVSPDGLTALSGSDDKTVKLWNLGTGALIRTFVGHTDAVVQVAFSPDGRSAVSSARVIKVWDVTSGAALRTFGADFEPFGIAFSPDGRTLLSGNRDNTLTLWDASSAAVLKCFSEHQGPVLSVAFSPDGRKALSGSEDATLRSWDVTTGNPLQTFGDPKPPDSEHGRDVRSVAFSPDGRTALSGAETMKLWDLNALAAGPPPPAPIRTFSSGDDEVRSVAFLPDGRSAIAASTPLSLWDVATGNLIREFPQNPSVFTAAAILANSRAVFGADTHNKVNTLHLYDLTTGAELRSFTGHSDFIFAVAVSPDGRTALSGSFDKTVKLWNLVTGTLIRTFVGQTSKVLGVAFSPDGRWAVSSGEAIKMWEVASGALLRTFQADAWGIAFSPDGHTLLSGNQDNTLTLWDANSAAALKTLSGHQGVVTSVAFSPDGRTALSGSFDATIRTWDIATGNPLRTLGVPKPPRTDDNRGVHSVAFSPDGRMALSGAETMKLWDLTTPA
ncbi:MAG: TIR domain-containing protein [Xanthobacteraceae bacterium]